MVRATRHNCWKSVNTDKFDFPFSEKEGIPLMVAPYANLLNYTQMHLTDAMFEKIVMETNLFAQQHIESNSESILNQCE